jgi:hypothetical protein
MPVTTRRQSRGLLNPNVIGGQLEDSAIMNFMRESEDDNDPMDGPITGLSTNEDEEEYESMGEEHESDASEGEVNHEEPDDADFEGMFDTTNGHASRVKLNYAVRPPAGKRRKVEKAGKASSSKYSAKTKRTGISRRIRGRLQNMLSLPLDVLFLVRLFRGGIAVPVRPEHAIILQILSELGPMDLVNLARTSKALRQVLMSRKSLSVWLVARRNAGLTRVPDPPEGMSEPAWALLLFGPAVCSVRGQLSLCAIPISSRLSTALLDQERSPGRFWPSSSLVCHL